MEDLKNVSLLLHTMWMTLIVVLLAGSFMFFYIKDKLKEVVRQKENYMGNLNNLIKLYDEMNKLFEDAVKNQNQITSALMTALNKDKY